MSGEICFRLLKRPFGRLSHLMHRAAIEIRPLAATTSACKFLISRLLKRLAEPLCDWKAAILHLIQNRLVFRYGRSDAFGRGAGDHVAFRGNWNDLACGTGGQRSTISDGRDWEEKPFPIFPSPSYDQHVHHRSTTQSIRWRSCTPRSAPRP